MVYTIILACSIAISNLEEEDTGSKVILAGTGIIDVN